MNTWTIYKHTLILTGNSFGKSYIGLTCKEVSKRWLLDGKGYRPKNQPAFAAAIKKYGWNNFKHEILETGIKTLEEANARERYWIAYYHTWIYDPACWGYNITKGGDGTPGHKCSKQTLMKFQKRVYCLELDTIFESISKAAMATNCNISKISLCCSGQRSKTGGYHWFFVAPDDTIIPSSFIPKKVGRKEKQVYCIELDQIFENAKEASIQTNSAYTSILRCCKKERLTAGGYHWQYIEEASNNE